MLPDFATMIGTRPPGVSHPELADGVRYHHATDRVFHETPTFRALQADARRTLREMGLPRPSALAVGHIGVEILLDSVLAADKAAVAAYLAAIREGRRGAFGDHIDWADPGTRERYEQLREALAERGAAGDTGTPRAVAWRVTRALAARPRLRLDAAGELLVHSWAEATRPIVLRASDGLIGQIRAGLGDAILAHRPEPFG